LLRHTSVIPVQVVLRMLWRRRGHRRVLRRRLLMLKTPRMVNFSFQSLYIMVRPEGGRMMRLSRDAVHRGALVLQVLRLLLRKLVLHLLVGRRVQLGSRWLLILHGWQLLRRRWHRGVLQRRRLSLETPRMHQFRLQALNVSRVAEGGAVRGVLHHVLI
jgi:hypothetical protein